MSKYTQAADVLKREASRYAALNEAAKVLDELGSLDQVANEAKARAIANTSEADSIHADIDKLKANAKKLVDGQAEKQKEADNIYAETIFNANTKASDVLAGAEVRAGQIVAAALSQAQTSTNVIQEQLAKLEATKATLTEEVAALQEAAMTANNEADAAEKRIAKIKASIAQLAGV